MGSRVIKADISRVNFEVSSPKVVTVFDGDGIGIDPDGCGCTDCILGDSINFNDNNADTLAILAYEVFTEGRKYYHRVGIYAKLVPINDGDFYGFKLKW